MVYIGIYLWKRLIPPVSEQSDVLNLPDVEVLVMIARHRPPTTMHRNNIIPTWNRVTDANCKPSELPLDQKKILFGWSQYNLLNEGLCGINNPFKKGGGGVIQCSQNIGPNPKNNTFPMTSVGFPGNPHRQDVGNSSSVAGESLTSSREKWRARAVL